MYKKLILVPLFALLLVLAACGSSGGDSSGGTSSGGSTGGGSTGASMGSETTAQQASAAYPITVTDSLGRKVEIKKQPKELGSMAPSITETIFAVGAGNRVAGVTTVDDYPKEVKNIEKIGDFGKTNAEKVASLGIEVLLLSFDSTTKEQATDLEKKTGAKVVVINPTSVDGAIQSIGLVGKVVGEPEKAQVVEERLQSELKQVTSAVEGEPKPTVFYELSYDPLFTVGPGSFVADAIRLAGGKNTAADAGQAYPQYPVEKLLKADPQYYLAGRSSGVTVKDIVSRKPYSSLQAVKKDRVFVINDDLVNRPGPRIVEGVREIAEILHPDAFKQ